MTQANKDAQSLSAMFGKSLGGSSEVVISKASSLSQKETASTQKRAYNPTVVDINGGVDKEIVDARNYHRENGVSQGRNLDNKSGLLDREKNNQSGKVEQHISTLFADLNQELRRLMMVYGLRKQSLRVTLHFTQGTIDDVSVSEGVVGFKREVQSLLIGRHIEMEYTGKKSHVLVVN